MALNGHNYLIHYGTKGMKWGYSDGQATGKRKAGDKKNDGSTASSKEDPKKKETEKKDDKTGKYENGLDKSKYTRVKLKNGKYVYNLRKEYQDFKKTESTKKRRLGASGFNPGRDEKERNKRYQGYLKKKEAERKKKEAEKKKKEAEQKKKATNKVSSKTSTSKKSTTKKNTVSSKTNQNYSKLNGSYGERNRRGPMGPQGETEEEKKKRRRS